MTDSQCAGIRRWIALESVGSQLVVQQIEPLSFTPVVNKGSRWDARETASARSKSDVDDDLMWVVTRD